jgi:hypothetical protein
MLKKLEDNFVLIYCFVLFNLAFLFLGHEIAQMQHDSEIRTAQRMVKQCQYVITKGSMYEI